MTRQGLTRCGKAGKVWHGSARLGRVRQCRQGTAGRGTDWQGETSQGNAGEVRYVGARRG